MEHKFRPCVCVLENGKTAIVKYNFESDDFYSQTFFDFKMNKIHSIKVHKILHLNLCFLKIVIFKVHSYEKKYGCKVIFLMSNMWIYVQI